MVEKGVKPLNNPNGANQWRPDPRQQLFIAYYKDPKSPTFSSARGSALKAGYTEEYADNIMAKMPEWLAESVGSLNPLLTQAEKNIREFMELPNETPAMGAFGPILKTEKVQDGFYKNGKPKFKKVRVPVMTLNSKIMKIKQDSSHFVAETVGKKKYSKSGQEGSAIFNVMIFANDQRNKIAARIIGGGSASDSESARDTD